METKEILQGVFSPIHSKNIRKEESSCQDFKQILERSSSRMMEDTCPVLPSVSQGSSPVGLDPITPLSVPFISEIKEAGSLRTQCVETTETTLDLLEKYQEAMGNPAVTLKKMVPLIQSLTQEVQDLRTLSETLPPSDPLKDLLDQVGILSAVEIEKFHRGDYL